MNKIPTVFVRDLETHKVIDEVTPGCEWVLAGEGVPTRKFDGTCVKFETLLGQDWWARREVKNGNFPDHWWEISYDKNTDRYVGWEPAEQSSFHKYLVEAIDGRNWEPGTYELCGPKINGNPEDLDRHYLFRHGDWKMVNPSEITFDSLRLMVTWVAHLASIPCPFEGVVWHHPDGRMAKLKRKDF